MRIRILSDLHLEFAAFDPPAVEADAVVLAGDIHQDIAGLAWAAQAFRGTPIVATSGNHEYYDGDWNEVPGRLRQAARELGIHFLDAGEAIIGDVRFLGCNLWTDFDLFGAASRALAYEAASLKVTDYRTIRVGRRRLVPEDTRALHLEQRDWLAGRLAEAPGGRWRTTVVVTHTLPSKHSVADEYLTDLTSAAFASDLDALVAQSDLWIHGHTHTSFDYLLPGTGTRVVCNPRGYRRRDGTFENPKFDAGLVLVA